jgi:hypothetical protein
MRLKIPLKRLWTVVHLNYIKNISPYLIENSVTFISNNRLISPGNNFCENCGKHADNFGKVRRCMKLQQVVPIGINALEKSN